MNLFEKFSKEIKTLISKNKISLDLNNINDFKGLTVENPPSKFNCDLSCNVALILGRINRVNPMDLAEKIKILLIKNTDIENVDIAGSGFLNIKLSKEYLKTIVIEILSNSNIYGSTKKDKKFNIEFVSANPTGPMHVGHCRGAVYGDVLANLLKFNGNDVIKEYYINDYGNQIINFTKSVFYRIKEIKYNEKFIHRENLYPGEYIVDIAKEILKGEADLDFKDFDKCYNFLSKKSIDLSMKMIKSDLNKLGITHDIFTSESNLVEQKLVSKVISSLKKENYVEEGFLDPPKGEESKNWKKTKKLIFKSTLFGDDANRALQKDDGSWTYFANDVAYHMNKVSRNYNNLINVLGADHTGYIKRITAAVEALSQKKVKLDCKVCQLVKLYKNGEPFKMSKRAGDFISASDLLEEVDKDSIRFMMLNRSNDVELDFDFTKVLEKSKENPVYYVQYCYARINSLFRNLKINLSDNIDIVNANFEFNDYETKILKKIFDWPKVVETASSKYEPHRIPFYLYELATLFHSYWSKGNEEDRYKFIVDGKIKNINILIIIKLTSTVVENGMKILGVSLPDKM